MEPETVRASLGFRRGVALAGASNLLMTTWEIQDEYTVEFMRRFYTSFLAGESPAEALHDVQSNELQICEGAGNILRRAFGGAISYNFFEGLNERAPGLPHDNSAACNVFETRNAVAVQTCIGIKIHA
jgi:hypothetical protein